MGTIYTKLCQTLSRSFFLSPFLDHEWRSQIIHVFGGLFIFLLDSMYTTCILVLGLFSCLSFGKAFSFSEYFSIFGYVQSYKTFSIFQLQLIEIWEREEYLCLCDAVTYDEEHHFTTTKDSDRLGALFDATSEITIPNPSRRNTFCHDLQYQVPAYLFNVKSFIVQSKGCTKMFQKVTANSLLQKKRKENCTLKRTSDSHWRVNSGRSRNLLNSPW